MSNKNSTDHGIDRYHDMDPSDETGAQLKSIYADWADTYDADNDARLGTVSQPNTTAMLARHSSNMNAEILDVGCGTGLVGMHLKRAGYSTYDGTDISADMMRHAAQRGYRNLFELQPDIPLPVADATYDVALCVGVFTHGHLGPDGIEELLRVVKPGGLVGFTVNEGVWEPGGFSQAIREHTDKGHWQTLEQKMRDYMVNENVRAWYIMARKSL